MKNTKSALASKAIIRFNALLGELYPQNKQEVKEAILAGYEVTSTKDLQEYQLFQIIDALVTEKTKRTEDAPKPIRALRHKCLTIMSQMGIDTNNWPRVNDFMLQPRICGKLLYECTEDELKALVPKLYAVKAAYDKRIEDEKTWAINN
jgi:hypothetical protein